MFCSSRLSFFRFTFNWYLHCSNKFVTNVQTFSTNQIADILHFNDNVSYAICNRLCLFMKLLLFKCGLAKHHHIRLNYIFVVITIASFIFSHKSFVLSSRHARDKSLKIKELYPRWASTGKGVGSKQVIRFKVNCLHN